MGTNIKSPIPPHAYEIELRTIACIVHIGDARNLRIQNAMLKLDTECFSNLDNRKMFSIIQELFSKSHEFDFVSFISILPDNLYSIASEMIQDNYVSSTHLEYDVEKLLTYRTWRRQQKILLDTLNASLESIHADQALEVIRNNLQALSNTTSNSSASIVRTYETIADEFLSEEEGDNSEFKVDIHNLPPVPNRSLITIAGRSGHGKTFFALYLMDKIIDAHPEKQTLYFNLEMHERVMMERHAKLLGVDGNSRREVISNGIGQLMQKNVSLISVPMITIDQIEAECRLASLRQPIGVIVVDYLGLVGSKTKYDRKDLQQGDIAKRLAALSLELDCVVICLIQVNREFKTRPVGDRCPVTSDASESMGSVYSSSWWIGIDQPQNDDSSLEFQDLFLVACRKNRGASGNFELQFKFKHGMFSEWQRPFSSYKKTSPDGF